MCVCACVCGLMLYQKTWGLEQDCHLSLVVLFICFLVCVCLFVLQCVKPSTFNESQNYMEGRRPTEPGHQQGDGGGVVNPIGILLSTITKKGKLERRRVVSVVVS